MLLVLLLALTVTARLVTAAAARDSAFTVGVARVATSVAAVLLVGLASTTTALLMTMIVVIMMIVMIMMTMRLLVATATAVAVTTRDTAAYLNTRRALATVVLFRTRLGTTTCVTDEPTRTT